MWRKAKGVLRRQLLADQDLLSKTAADAKKAAAAAKKNAEDMQKILRDIRWELQEQRKYMETFRHFVARDVLAEVGDFTDNHQLGLEQTIELISRERLSFARFGDGEFRSMLRPDFNLRFQPWSPGLAGDLRSVLTFEGYDRDRLLLGFPYPYRNLHWSGVWLDIWHELKPLLQTSLTYGNSHVSRPIFFQQLGQTGVELWRSVWDGQEVCIVTGEGSRFSIPPELFDNIKAIRYVYSTPINAYANLPQLMETLRAEDQDQLYLVSLGPAGTLVSAWLSQTGRWAIDIGHISDSWANVFAGGKWPESLDVRK